MKTFIDLMSRLGSRDLLIEVAGPAEDVVVEALSNDSRSVRPGSLFCAIRGARTDGHLFIDKAVENGASALVYEAAPGDDTPGVAFARVSDARAAWAALSCAFHEDPSEKLDLVGVTGTNGKTTVSHVIHRSLVLLGQPTGLLGTIRFDDGRESIPATHTTPDAAITNAWLERMVANGCCACSMEVSSHALDQDRVAGLRFAVGIFTNLTHDHLDYHDSFESYLASKRRLFASLSSGATAVANADDPSTPAVTRDTRATVVTFGAGADADIRFAIRADGFGGLSLHIDGADMQCRLMGAFNAYNLAAAYACLLALGRTGSEARAVLAEVDPVPGRFEQLRRVEDGVVIVDYAHTPDALENVLRAIGTLRAAEAVAGARVWCVFGCGGDRDRGKRPEMGRIAEALADRVVVTSDNPRSEDPLKIMDDIRAGMRRPERAEWVADRRAAIRRVARLAGPSDIVLIAGKGHEAYQEIRGTRRDFDDRAVVREHFRISDARHRMETPTP